MAQHAVKGWGHQDPHHHPRQAAPKAVDVGVWCTEGKSSPMPLKSETAWAGCQQGGGHHAASTRSQASLGQSLSGTRTTCSQPPFPVNGEPRVQGHQATPNPSMQRSQMPRVFRSFCFISALEGTRPETQLGQGSPFPSATGGKAGKMGALTSGTAVPALPLPPALLVSS